MEQQLLATNPGLLANSLCALLASVALSVNGSNSLLPCVGTRRDINTSKRVQERTASHSHLLQVCGACRGLGTCTGRILVTLSTAGVIAGGARQAGPSSASSEPQGGSTAGASWAPGAPESGARQMQGTGVQGIPVPPTPRPIHEASALAQQTSSCTEPAPGSHPRQQPLSWGGDVGRSSSLPSAPQSAKSPHPSTCQPPPRLPPPCTKISLFSAGS